VDLQLDWDQLVVKPLADMLKDIIAFTPNVVSSVLTIVFGIFIAIVAREVVRLFLKSAGFDSFAEKVGLFTDGPKEGKPKTAPHQYGGLIAYWIVIFTAIIAALNNLQLRAVSFQLSVVFNYAVTVLAVAVLAVIGIFLATLVGRVIKSAATSSGYANPGVLAAIGKWTVITLTFLICLFRAGVPEQAFLIFLGATYVTLCITFIIAFGVGGAGFASEVLRRLLKASEKKM
jgi:Mechanosensitive ion channel, conserved TM helix